MQARRRRVLAQRMVAAHGVERIDAIVDMNLVPAPAKRLAQPIDVSGVATETVPPKNVVTMQNFTATSCRIERGSTFRPPPGG